MTEMQRPARLDTRGRVAMISGANRGIGLAIARRLYEDGYDLSLGARDTEALTAATAEMAEARVLRHAFDATRREDAGLWAEATVARFGRIDAVINNAGISGRFAFDALDEAVLDRMWEVNVKAPYRVILAALPHLRAGGEGRIVNLVSLAGIRQLTSSAAYTISKFAAMGLTHSARHYLFEDGIRVTAICPGDTLQLYVCVDIDILPSVGPVTASPSWTAVYFAGMCTRRWSGQRPAPSCMPCPRRWWPGSHTQKVGAAIARACCMLGHLGLCC